MSRAVLAEGSAEGAGVSEDGDGEPEGMVWATVRKNSSMYWRDWGSYWEFVSVQNERLWMECRITNIDWVDVTLVEGVHVPVW